MLPAGYRVNDYVVERPLGGGGFGVTYLARDANLDLTVALKEYFPHELASRGADLGVEVRGDVEDAQAGFDAGLERFLDEARALASFRHPNIVRVLRYFRANGTAYIVMEYESGQPLKRWVPDHAPLTRRSLLAIVHPLLDGLEAVHAAGFLHRDVKPDNVYVRADGTPVLLDFGSARRLTGARDLTNIVSPGFAPFEQYHDNGRQGPWTDLYSLGAVMYWMVTGKKPADASTRVKDDPMLPAAGLGEPAVFGLPLLRAIDWALHPDETQRPQAVADLRAALQAADQAEPLAPGADPRSAVPPSGYANSAGGPSSAAGGAASPSTPHRRTLVCTLMVMDLVGGAARSAEGQATFRRVLDELVAKAVKGVPEDTRLRVDTAEGAALCFLGDPEEALHSAMLLRDLVGQRYGRALPVRIGVHMGPVRIVATGGERVTVVGDGLNVAQRIMDFAQGHQVLVSRAYYDVISRITDDAATLLRYVGQHEDKHGRRHEVYAVDPAPREEKPSTGYSQTLPMRTIKPLDAAAVLLAEAELARHIGPLARVLVRKAQPLCRSLAELREALAPSIQDPRAREAFLGGGARSVPASVPSVPSAPSGTTSGRRLAVPEEDLVVVEQALSRFIGPMARMLVRKELSRAGSFKELVLAMARTVDQPVQREAFLAAVKRGLPRRQAGG